MLTLDGGYVVRINEKIRNKNTGNIWIVRQIHASSIVASKKLNHIIIVTEKNKANYEVV